MRHLARRLTLLSLLALMVASMGLGCSSNRRVSGGVGLHRDSSGNWGHSVSIGIHGNRR